ncbi:MAG: helix-turn-helix transcriptional regulator [Proteobacteria bacterium]|nr:helix-turn-helix transcriptional regulator [Pseudomonadota bacterium]
MIAKNGYAATSVNAVAHRAGMTIGALYGRFGSKQALLQGLFERLSQQTTDVFDKLIADLAKGKPELRHALERSLEAMRWLYRERAALLRALNQAAATNPTLRKRMLKFNADTCARLYLALDRYSARIAHPRPALAMKFGHEAAMRLLRSSMLYEEIDYRDLRKRGIEVTDELLVREATRIWEAYLTSRS